MASIDPHWLLLLLILCFSVQPSSSDPRATEAAIVCSNKRASLPQRQAFLSNFIAALNSLAPLVASQGFGFTLNGSKNLSIYAFGECIKDLSPLDCNLCFAEIRAKIQKCLPYQQLTLGGRLFLDGCYLRYDDHSFYDQFLTPDDRIVCSIRDFVGNRTVFKANVVELVKNLSSLAVKNGGFIYGSVSKSNATVHGLAQCWEFVNSSACRACLGSAVVGISSCPPRAEGRVMNAGCYMRYSIRKFYNNSATPLLPPRGPGRRRLTAILAATLSAFACTALVAGAAFLGREKLKRRKENRRLKALLSAMQSSELNFSYEILEEATDYFADRNKLGQGGSGSVYKGTLPDGSLIAVKRLFFSTRQWVDHFFNEINLISRIQHKNLVKLLGCSITGPESLLVYEFVPNLSLHDHIFVEKNARGLSWEKRYSIILGTAEGLAYLHEETNLKIIHRDIKLSNVLLDRDFTPKIADFGLVRLLPEDKSHLSTLIAGTLGYMAPEYIVRGVLTEKADVYSFGVLMIEVISGKKNNSFSEDAMCMLHMIWNLYVRGQAPEAVDCTLEGKFSEEEAHRLLQIGLLCVQADPELRPSMSMVVRMLSVKDHQLPVPMQPPFLNSSSAEITRSIQHESTSSRPYSHSGSSNDGVTESLIER